MPEPSRQQT